MQGGIVFYIMHYSIVWLVVASLKVTGLADPAAIGSLRRAQVAFGISIQ